MAKESQRLSQTASYGLTLLVSVLIAINGYAYDRSFDGYVDNLAPQSYIDISFYGGTGQRKGELRWNIAGDPTGPNILSELTFADLSITEVQGGADLRFNQGMLRNISIEANIKKGSNKDGIVTDSDYNENNRTDEYSRSESNPDDSTTLDGKLLFGYRMKWNENIFITPMIGYRYNQQSLKMKEGVQILDTRTAAISLGPFSSNLDSTYEAEWHNAVFGLDTQYRKRKHQLALRWEFTLSEYYAEANWNLRSDFAHPKSFAHWARGTGNNIELRYQYDISSFFSVWASYRIEDWKTSEGDDTVYFSDGTKAGTQLNEVVWKSSASAAGIAFNF